MTLSNKQYIEQREDGYYVAGSRVSLDSIVYLFLEGQSAETITQAFPTLTLEEVYGAIAFYLGHRDEIDGYLKQQEADFEPRRQAARERDPMFYQKLANARGQLSSPRS